MQHKDIRVSCISLSAKEITVMNCQVYQPGRLGVTLQMACIVAVAPLG
jgi:hypothetical protein